MQRLLFHVCYDGSSFSGWQSQPSGNTIQDTLETALASLHHHPVRIHGSGRTDAGVHALDQCFHIDTELNIPLPQWPLAMNANLPESIRIMQVEHVGANFHARFSATGKTYTYIISQAPILSPFDSKRVWHHPHSLDETSMLQGLHEIQGTRNFQAFAALRGNEPSPLPEDYFVRTIHTASMKRESERMILTFSGNGFLYKMVRLLVGRLHCLGSGKLSPSDFTALLQTQTSAKSPYCAPPDGLYLSRVHYAE